MREIKFRAWDFYEKEMYSADKCKVNAWLPNGSSCLLYPKGHEKEFQLRLEFMQFTGLKDKKGKEIYEGDTDKKRGVCKKKFYVFENEDGFECLVSNITNDIEIIGNIYENPELLKGD